MPRAHQQLGIGATVSFPANLVSREWAMEHFPDTFEQARVHGVVLAEEVIPRKGKERRMLKVKVEVPAPVVATVVLSRVSFVRAGPSQGFFANPASSSASASAVAGPAPPEPVPPVAADGEGPEDNLQEETLDEPPDDIIAASEGDVEGGPQGDGPVAWEAWGSVPIHDRAAGGATRFPCNFSGLTDPIHKSIFALFEIFLPPRMVDGILEATNAAGTAKYTGRWKSLTRGELPRWLGLWLAMCPQQSSRSEHLKAAPKEPMFSGFGFGEYMSRHRFETSCPPSRSPWWIPRTPWRRCGRSKRPSMTTWPRCTPPAGSCAWTRA